MSPVSSSAIVTVPFVLVTVMSPLVAVIVLPFAVIGRFSVA